MGSMSSSFSANTSVNGSGNQTCESCNGFGGFDETDVQKAAARAPCASCNLVDKVYEGEVAKGSTVEGRITVEKTAPKEIVKGDVVEVRITVSNGLLQEMELRLRETIGHVDIIDPGVLKRTIASELTSAPPYYDTILKVPANSSASITYKIKPLYYGEYKILPTEVYAGKGVIASNDNIVNVKCNENNICEISEDENALTCPHDCSPKEKDSLCNPMKDGVCDPDCKQDEDPDCRTTTTTMTAVITTTTIAVNPCGNGVCEPPVENYASCSRDCSSGSADKYCDKVKDGRCDPDCKAEDDPDCQKPGMGAFVIVIAVVLALVVFIAYKKQWLKLGR